MSLTVGPNLGVLVDGAKGEEHYAQLMRQWRALDGLIQCVAITMGGAFPPGTSNDGDVHVVGTGAAGLWAGRDNCIARYYTVGDGAPGWDFFAPKSGWQARILSHLDADDLPQTIEFDGTAWKFLAGGGSAEIPVIDITASNYNLLASHNGAYVRMIASGPTTVTVRAESVHALPDNGAWHIRNGGDSDLEIVPQVVAINLPAGGSLTVPAGGTVTIKRVSTDEFDLIGVTAGSGGGGSGTVTSVAVSVPAGLAVSGSPITSAGTINITFAAGYSIPTTAKQEEWDAAYADRNKWDGGSTGLNAATGRTSLGATTVGGSLFTLANPSAISYPRINANNTVTAVSASTLAGELGVTAKLDTSAVGVTVASLVGGVVPSNQLPSYVDDVLEYANLAAFPASGETGKIYIAIDTNRQYRWSGSAYVQIVSSPGTTDNVPEGSTNQYHTQARVRSSVLTGFVAATGLNAVLATDTILQAFNKIQGWLNGLGNLSTITGSSAVVTLLGSANTAALRTNIGATTVGSNFIATANPSAISFPRVNADNTVSYLDAAAFRTAIGAGSGLTNFTEARDVSGINSTTPAISLSVNEAAQSDAHLVLRPKNYGSLLCSVPTGTSVGGNQRGLRTVDLQRLRSSATQVASGDSAVIAGGELNTASGSKSVVVGGYSNTAGGDNSVAGGQFCEATGESSVAFGSTSQATAKGSTATGIGARDRGVASRVFSSGSNNFAEYDQIREVILRGSTNDAVSTPLTTEGTGVSLIATRTLNLAPYSAYIVEGTVVAFVSSGISKSWKISALISRPFGSTDTSIIGTPTITVTHQESGTESLSLSVSANSTLAALVVNVIGSASNTTRWTCYLKSIELTYQ